MKNVLLTGLFLVLFAGAAAAQTHDHGQASAQASAKPQEVKLSIDDSGAYVVTPSKVSKGVPVKMDVDLERIKGCARTVVIKAFKVKKTVKSGDTTIEFTPDKSGPTEIVCGMNMVKGTLTVTEAK